MSANKQLLGKVAVVAGATRGAGRGIACMLGEAGATVFCTGRSVPGQPARKGRPETIDETAALVTQYGGFGIPVRVDHTIREQVLDLFKRVESEKGRLDILVNNVNGDDLYEWKPFWKQSLHTGFVALERGIHSHLMTIHAALPLMMRQGGLIASITDQGGGTFFYGFVKQSVMKMAQLLAAELIPHDITMVSLTPGFLRSEAVLERYGVTESNWRDAAKKDPFFACSETTFYVGRAVAALASDRRSILKTGSLLSSWGLAEEYGFTDIDGSQPNVERCFAPLLDERWIKVVDAVRTEFQKHDFNPADMLREDRQTMTVKARLQGNGPAQWLTELVGPGGVAHGNPQKIAAEFYKRFEKLTASDKSADSGRQRN
jgi:NAD(P)-dependent dehydrogenase (short-subunit alcohol dehydrogenase family)